MAPSEAPTQHSVFLQAGIQELYMQPEFSDFTIICGGKNIPAHKTVICTQSPFFYKACATNMIEKTTNTVELNDDESDAVQAMIEYMYRGSYTKQGNLDLVLLHVHVYALAEKYQIPYLQVVAEEKFASIIQLRYQDPVFQQAVALALSIIPEHDSGLRTTIVTLCCKKINVLVKIPGFEDLLNHEPGLAVDIVMMLGLMQEENRAESERMNKPGPKKRAKISAP